MLSIVNGPTTTEKYPPILVTYSGSLEHNTCEGWRWTLRLADPEQLEHPMPHFFLTIHSLPAESIQHTVLQMAGLTEYILEHLRDGMLPPAIYSAIEAALGHGLSVVDDYINSTQEPA